MGKPIFDNPLEGLKEFFDRALLKHHPEVEDDDLMELVDEDTPCDEKDL